MTAPRLHFTWSDGVCCDLCNPAKLAHFEQIGVLVRGPTWQREVCVACIMTLEGFYVGKPETETQLEQEVCDVFAQLGGLASDPMGSRIAAVTCQCGAPLPDRTALASDLRDALQALLHLPGQRFELGVARVMFGVLCVVSRLEHCDACSEKRVGDAFEAITAAALQPKKRRQPYVAPAIDTTEPTGGAHDK